MPALLFAVEAWEAWGHLVRLVEPFLPVNKNTLQIQYTVITTHLTK